MSAPDATSAGDGLAAEGLRRRETPSESGEGAVGGPGAGGVPVGLGGPVGARRTTKQGPRRDTADLRLIAIIIGIPIASLAVLVPTLRYVEKPGVAPQIRCSGESCRSATAAVAAAAAATTRLLSVFTLRPKLQL